MKEGWKYKNAGEVFYITDYVANGSFATLRENVRYKQEKDYAVLVRLADYSNGFDDSKFVYVDEHAYNFLSKSTLYGGEIIMSNVGSVGKCFICPDLGMPMTLAPNSILIKTPESTNRFYYYFFSSEVFAKQLNTITSQATLAKVNKTQFKTLPVPVLPLSAQERIVSYLDSAFAKIDQLKSNAEKQMEEAKALFASALQSEMEPKEGWEEKTLGDCGTFTRGGNFLKSDFIDNGVPCVHYGQIHTKFGLSTDKHLASIPAEKAKKMASKGDLLIAITSEDVEGSCKCTAWLGDYEVAMGGHSAIYKHSFDPKYIAYYFRTLAFYREKAKYTHGFKVIEIKPSDIAKIPVPVPSLNEQQQIVSRLDALLEEVHKLENNSKRICAECDAMKQAILRETFE